MFVRATLHQLKVAIDTYIKMLNQLKYEELQCTPIPNKRSLFEICTHLSLICHADLLILNGSTQEQLHTFYLKHTPKTIAHMQQTLLQGYEHLSETFSSYSNDELSETMTAYWGVSYLRFEWLLEIIAHFYHHREQMHILLVEHVGDPYVSLFE
ncbi:DinB family protein [Bacillus sp. C1]